MEECVIRQLYNANVMASTDAECGSGWWVRKKCWQLFLFFSSARASSWCVEHVNWRCIPPSKNNQSVEIPPYLKYLDKLFLFAEKRRFAVGQTVCLEHKTFIGAPPISNYKYGYLFINSSNSCTDSQLRRRACINAELECIDRLRSKYLRWFRYSLGALGRLLILIKKIEGRRRPQF